MGGRKGISYISRHVASKLVDVTPRQHEEGWGEGEECHMHYEMNG